MTEFVTVSRAPTEAMVERLSKAAADSIWLTNFVRDNTTTTGHGWEDRRRADDHAAYVRGIYSDALHQLRVAKGEIGVLPKAPSPMTDSNVQVTREDVERDIRLAIWNAGKWQGKSDEVAQSLIRKAMSEPTMIRAIAALAPVSADGQGVG